MGENLTAGILKSIEMKAEVSIKLTFDILTVVKTTNEILSKEIGKELKKQTKILGQILKGIVTLEKTKAVVAPMPGDKVTDELLGAITDKKKLKLLETASPIIRDLADSIMILIGTIEKITPEILMSFNRLLRMSERLLTFAQNMVLAGILLTISLLITVPAMTVLVLWMVGIFILSPKLRKASRTLLYISIVWSLLVTVLLGTALLLLTDATLMTKAMTQFIFSMTMLVAFFILISLPKIDKMLSKGTRSLMYIAITIGIIMLTIWFAVNEIGGFGEIIYGVLMITLALFIIGFAFVLAGKMAKQTRKGAKSLLFVSLSMALIFAVIWIVGRMFGGTEETARSIFWVSVAVLMLSLAWYVIGKAATTIFKGALVMIIVTGVFYYIAESMVNWRKARITVGDVALVLGLIVGLGTVMGIAGIPPLSAAIGIGAGVMLIAAGALWVIADALVNFKKADWTGKDTERLGKAIMGIAKVFVDVFKEIPITDWNNLRNGISVLGDIGDSMSSLAQGFKAFGELNMIEYEYDDKGNVIGVNNKGKIDPKAIGDGIAAFIDPLVGKTSPLAKLGEGDSFWSASPISRGVGILADLGDALSSLGEGYSAMAKLEFVTYTEDENGKLIVDQNSKGKNKIDPKAIANGIKALVEPLVGTSGPLYQLGKDEGMIFSGPIGNGIELLGNLGGAIADFADGLVNIANLKIPAYELIKGTGTGPDNPARYTKKSGQYVDFTETMAKQVGTSIQFLVTAISGPISQLGSQKGGWFSSTDFEKGVKFMNELGDPIHKFVTAMVEITKMGGEDNSKKITSVLNSLLRPVLVFFHEKSLAKMDTDKGKEILETMGEYIEKFSEFNNAEQIGEMFVNVKKSINGLDYKKLQVLNKVMFNLSKFAEHMNGKFSDLVEVLEELALVLEKIQDIEAPIDKTVAAVKKDQGEGLLGKVGGALSSLNPFGGDSSTGGESIDVSEIVNQLKAINNTLISGIEVEAKGGSFLST